MTKAKGSTFSKDLTKLIRTVGFPQGAGTGGWDDSIWWGKRGGHAGSKTISKVMKKAIEAACVIRRAAAELSDVKARLRAEAEIVSIKRGDKEQVEFESAAGTATVVFVDDVPRITKELDPRDIKGALGPELWTTLFREEVSLAPGFSKAYEELPARFKRIVRKYVAWEPTSARVLLPKIDKEQEEQWLKRAS